jgi:hypothetical protein
MAINKGSDGWDDDDDTPLAFVVKPHAKPEPAPVRASEAPKPAEKKKEKAPKEKAAKPKRDDWDGVDKILRARDAGKISNTPQWKQVMQQHGSKILIGVCVFALIYFRCARGPEC